MMQNMVRFVLSMDRLWLNAERLQRALSRRLQPFFLISTFYFTKLSKTPTQFRQVYFWRVLIME